MLAGTGCPTYGLWRPATPSEIAGWDIDVRADGQELPPWSGSVRDGLTVYAERCAAFDAETLPKVQMPNRHGFTFPDPRLDVSRRPTPLVAGSPSQLTPVAAALRTAVGKRGPIPTALAGCTDS